MRHIGCYRLSRHVFEYTREFRSKFSRVWELLEHEHPPESLRFIAEDSVVLLASGLQAQWDDAQILSAIKGSAAVLKSCDLLRA